jgi:hypothetical protein
MGWSISIGTIAGTVVRIHLTFLLFLGWIFLAGWYSGGALFRRRDTDRDAAADWRRRAARAHSRKAE